MLKRIAALGLAAILLCGCTAVLTEQTHTHSYDWDYYEHDGTYHWRVCLECGEKLYYTAHFVYCNNPNKRVCEACGAALADDESAVLHVGFEQRHDGQYHWMECTGCGTIKEMAAHTDTCSQPGVCTVCGAAKADGAEVISSSHAYVLHHDESGHWYVCQTCGAETEKEGHFASCANPDKCLQCGALKSEGAVIPQPNHDWQLRKDDKYHWDECSVCGLITSKEEHYVLCISKNPHACSICGAAEEDGAAIGLVTHYYSDPMEYDDDSHWYICAMCGNKIIEGAHVFQDGKCAVCGFQKPAEPTATPTPEATEEPTATPTPEITAAPTVTPTPEITAKPTAEPTAKPTAKPTAAPTAKPTAKPTAAPTAKPTAKPTAAPTAKPASTPSPLPSKALAQQLPHYTVEDIFYDGSYISGRVVHEKGTPEAEHLFIRLELLLPNGSNLAVVLPVSGEDGAFEAAVAGNVMLTRIIITDTIRCVRPDDVWNQLGIYTF